MIEVNNICVDNVISTVGHNIHRLDRNTGNMHHCYDEVKRKLNLVRGCPINKRMNAKMSRPTFIRTCLAFQERAGLHGDKKFNDNKQQSRSTPTGWRNRNKIICGECSIAKKVREGKRFQPPKGIELVNLKIS